MIKQVIVIRKDLNMRKGKLAAQACHSSMKVFFDRTQHWTRYNTDPLTWSVNIAVTAEMREWMLGAFTKICVSVDSEAELLDVYSKAQAKNLPCALITDSGLTEFHGIPTNTVVAVGPAEASLIDEITGHLKLL